MFIEIAIPKTNFVFEMIMLVIRVAVVFTKCIKAWKARDLEMILNIGINETSVYAFLGGVVHL